ncbi:hypothetical protein EST38_g14019 [Candolleomyces aberdarensis]|uniref:ATP-dependent DNA helicase n=1 Tax=Candolleomyces aberdarensis TaxID=2316362 RepID=A0A4Q2D088_9AGAR|nr:hypothetical protein EST38_g14019 [Candolleomyces aberdarensis]
MTTFRTPVALQRNVAGLLEVPCKRSPIPSFCQLHHHHKETDRRINIRLFSERSNGQRERHRQHREQLLSQGPSIQFRNATPCIHPPPTPISQPPLPQRPVSQEPQASHTLPLPSTSGPQSLQPNPLPFVPHPIPSSQQTFQCVPSVTAAHQSNVPSVPVPNRRSEAQRRRWERWRQERQASQNAHQLRSSAPTTPALTSARQSTAADIERTNIDGQNLRLANGTSIPVLGAARRPYQEPQARHELGRMNIQCPDCRALHWLDEKLSSSSARSPKFGLCCDSGQVRLPRLEDPPPALRDLFTGEDRQALEFQANVWKYNRAFAFTSLCANEDHSVNRGHGEPVFRILGELYHRSGPLQPSSGRQPIYAQLYFYDPHEAQDQRASLNEGLNRQTLDIIHTTLDRHNPYAAIFRYAWEFMQHRSGGGGGDVTVRLRPAPGVHHRRGNIPTADEVAVIICDSNGEDPSPRDVVLHQRTGHLSVIHDLHPAYAPLYYVLLFPYGEPGWHPDLRMHQPTRSNPHRLSQSRFVAYRLQIRPNEFSTILRGKRLLQRYLVDMYASIDQNRLRYLRHNQPQLRACLYSGLQDSLSADDEEVDLNQLGQKVILPSSYIGGPRHMQQRYQDSMAIARHFRRCDIFLTMTCNPHWPEITRELLPGQTTYDRPDLIARVFQLKKKALLQYIYKHGILGSTVAYVYTIEFQKRGLPHMHALIFLADGWKLDSIDTIDSCISAELPDEQSQPKLWETVTRCMIHGPCGAENPQAPCMENGRCTKGYPGSFSDFTTIDENGFPQYRRRNNGRRVRVGEHEIDNRWIVPYCPLLSALFNCHINCEYVASAGSFKYLFKYIQKGGDMASLQIDNDEITNYLNGRYISAAEAVHRIFHFDTHDQVPNVVRLQVHLPGQHMVVFDPSEDPQRVLARAAQEQTTLTAWFTANRDAGAIGTLARQHTYQEFPQHFVWKDALKRWDIRRQGFAIGRMYFVGPTAGERFYLRTLLSVVKGATSYEDLKTYQGIRYDTFHAACLARGLLEDDGEWRQCLTEACEMQVGVRLRRLFATILMFCGPSRPDLLWSQFWRQVCDDLPLRLRAMGFQNASDNDIQDYGLYLLNETLKDSGPYTLANFPSMPQPTRNWDQERTNPLITEQLNYDRAQQHELLQQQLPLLNEEQRAAYDLITKSVEQNLAKVFFVNGPGGTGKTFLYNVVCNSIRSTGKIVLCVASSGIAAVLLPGGRTSHSMFSIPITIHEDSICPVDKSSNRASLMREASAIIWDEIGAQHRHAVEAVDRMLRDVRDDQRPFGGLTVVFGGDFQQTLPVVPRGSREEIVHATILKSYIWENVQILHLRQNMRVRDDPQAAEFAQWLLDVGHGQGLDEHSKFTIPDELRVQTYDDLVNFVYAGIDQSPPPPPEWFLNRMILAPRNSDVAESNRRILGCMAESSMGFPLKFSALSRQVASHPASYT